MRIGLASDHVGFEPKERLKARVTRQGHTAEDRSAAEVGEYHAITDQLASAIRRGRLERGVLICSGAIGRIHRANGLLLEANEEIVDIARVVGFENQAHFATVFANLVAMTPRQSQRSSNRDSGGAFRPSLSVAEC